MFSFVNFERRKKSRFLMRETAKKVFEIFLNFVQISRVHVIVVVVATEVVVNAACATTTVVAATLTSATSLLMDPLVQILLLPSLLLLCCCCCCNVVVVVVASDTHLAFPFTSVTITLTSNYVFTATSFVSVYVATVLIIIHNRK